MRWLPLVLLTGCAHTTPHTVHTERNDLAALLDADRAFAADVAKRGLEAWTDAFTSDGAAFPANAPLTIGRGAIHELMAPAFATPGFRIEWTPQRADASGDLGYTIGFYEVHAPKNGTDVVTRGKYLTVWKRQPNGAWKVAADAGTPGQ